LGNGGDGYVQIFGKLLLGQIAFLAQLLDFGTDVHKSLRGRDDGTIIAYFLAKRKGAVLNGN
jgi:hypothetical protein